jgi:alpha-soluble NSF attachment protein
MNDHVMHAGREAALAFGEQAAYDLKLGDELSAASALLRSAKCYTWIHDQGTYIQNAF